MLKIYQQTISKPITLTGVGLHSGLESKIVIKPGKEDQGMFLSEMILRIIIL